MAEDLPKSLADQKTELEIQKLRREVTAVARYAPQIVSFAAVVIAGSQFWLAWQASEKQQASQHNDFLLRCIDAGLKAADYSARLREDFVAGRESKQIAMLNVVLTSFPPRTALRVLDALGSETTTPLVKDQYLRAREAVEEAVKTLSGGETACPAVDYVLLQTPPVQVATRIPVSNGVASAAPAPAPAPEPAGPPLDVYVQIVRAADRVQAQRVMAAFGAPAAFPKVLGPDLVEQRDPLNFVAEIRYYFADQKGQAEMLARMLTAAAEKAGVGGLGRFRVVQLPARFANLARDRIEVWFPVLQPPG